MGNPEPWYIWTDFGGVLTPPIAEQMAAFCAKYGLAADDMMQALRCVAETYGVSDPLELMDRPMITETEWLAALNKELGGVLSLTTLADAWFDGRETNKAWVDVLREVRDDNVRVGMLSNMVPTWDQHWRKMVDARTLFDHVVLSFQEGHRKPEPRFFATAAAKAGVQPDRCILVDDLEKNCAGAVKEGWQAIHFQDATRAKTDLLNILHS